MEIIKLKQSENCNTRTLYEEVFQEDSKEFVDYYYTEKTKDNEIYVVWEDHAVRAMLHLNPYTLLVNGEEKETNYIVAVATQEEYRRRGYMAELLKKALNDMYQAGHTFTFLMPAAEAIYLPHDFRTVYEQEKKYYRQEADLKEDIQISPAKPADCRELAEWTQGYLERNYQVFAKRDERYYERLIKEYASDGGKLMLYRRDGDLTDCRIYVPEGEEQEKPKIMVRIIDVRRMVMSVKVKRLTGVCFHITDPVIKENNRCAVLFGTESSGIMYMDGKPESSEGTITIAALTSFLFGAKTVEEVCEEEGVEMSDRMIYELNKIIPLSKIYLNEVV